MLVIYSVFVLLSGGFPGGTVVKNPPANAGASRDMGLVTESRRSRGAVNGNPLQCSCLENFMDREAWWATVHEAAESYTTEHLSTHACTAVRGP